MEVEGIRDLADTDLGIESMEVDESKEATSIVIKVRKLVRLRLFDKNVVARFFYFFNIAVSNHFSETRIYFTTG